MATKIVLPKKQPGKATEYNSILKKLELKKLQNHM